MSGNMRLAICVAEAYNKPRKPRTPAFTSIDEQAIYGAYQRGMTMTQIADIHRCSRRKISKAIQRQHRATTKRR